MFVLLLIVLTIFIYIIILTSFSLHENFLFFILLINLSKIYNLYYFSEKNFINISILIFNIYRLCKKKKLSLITDETHFLLSFIFFLHIIIIN